MSKLLAEAHITVSIVDGVETVNVTAHRYNKKLRIQTNSISEALLMLSRRLKPFERAEREYAFEADTGDIG